MSTIVLVAVLAVLLAAIALVGWRILRLRGTRLVTCPETRETVAVEIAAGQAALTSLTGDARFRLTDCTRWPERQGCDRACLDQVEAAPRDCLVRTILAHWYEGKRCGICRVDLSATNWPAHRPALLGPDGTSAEWQDFAPERIPEILATHAPLCFDCHVAESFRRLHPDLVTDRPWPREGAS
jgi:hypothetical protein